MDEGTKKALLYSWVNGSWNEELTDDIISSDEQREEFNYGNPPNTDTNSFFKPYLDAQEKNENYEIGDERKNHGGNISKVNDINLKNAPNFDNTKDEQLNERVCRAEKFEVIKYSLGPNEEYIAINTSECNAWKRNEEIVSPSNPSTSNLKRHNRRCSKQPFILEESPIDTMADQRTMAELLRAPTEGYVEVIVVPPILAEQFELKYSLINKMTLDQFFELEKDNPHDHIRWFNKITSTIRYKDVPNSAIKLMLFPFSLAGAARRTTNLLHEISNFQQRFDESFHEACDRYKDLLRACPHYGFTELHQLDTFYNALNPVDQDSLNSVAGGNLLERRTQDVLTIIEKKSKVRNSRNKSVVSQVKSCDANSNSSSKIAKLTYAVNQQTSAVTTAITAILKQFQATPPPASVKTIEEICVTCGAAAVNYNQGNSVYRPLGSGSLPSNTVSNPKGKLKAITTRSGIVLDGPSVPTPPPFINLEVYERVEETLTDQDLTEYTIKVPPPLVQKCKPPCQIDFFVHQRDPLHPNIDYPSRMLKQKQQEKNKVQIHKFWQMFKQLHINITLADALILMPKYQKMLKALLSNKEKLQELAKTPLNENCSAVILKKLPKKLRDPGKFLIPFGFSELKCKTLANLDASNNLMPLSVWKKLADFVIVDYQSDPRVPLILGRPFLRTAHALIDVYGEEMILCNEVKDDIFDLEGGNVLPKKLLDLDSTKDLHPPLHVNPLSGNTTFSSLNHLLEEFADELSLITFPPEYDDNLQFDIKFDLREIEYLLHHDPIKDIDSSLKDSIDQIESDTKNVYDDIFDSKGEKIKESKLLINELDLPCDFFLPSEYDSILSEDFSRVDALPSTNNEDKVFNPCILIQENPFEIITRVVQDKKLAIFNASLMLEDFDPPLYELLFFKEVSKSKMLLLFSSENEEKVFKPGIHTSKKVHSTLTTELSHQGYKVFKINQIFKSPMKIFLSSCRKDTHILAVHCLHFYPLDQFKYGGIGSS
nr:reverse transcriptase domain-containing protein [Tanacetum cinerariifolium]